MGLLGLTVSVVFSYANGRQETLRTPHFPRHKKIYDTKPRLYTAHMPQRTRRRRTRIRRSVWKAAHLILAADTPRRAAFTTTIILRDAFRSRWAQGRRETGGTHAMRGSSRMTIRPSHPYDAGTEHVRFSPTQEGIACTEREALLRC